MFVFSNLAMSLDGKIATPSRVLYALGTPYDRKRMQTLRKQSDVVVFGAESLRAYRKPCIVAGSKKQPANAVISTALSGISPSWPFFTKKGLKRLLLVSESAPSATLRRFESSSEIVILSGKRPMAHRILAALEARGYERTLVEGGGNLMWEFARENLIEEYHVTLTPKIVGGATSPTLVDGQGFEPGQVLGLRLASCRRIGQELYLKYQSRTPTGLPST